MFKGLVKTIKTLDKTNQLSKSLNKLKEMDVLVGVPMQNSSREDGGQINNAELVYIHTNGSPIRNIPARPIIEPAIESKKDEIGEQLQEAIKNVLSDKPFTDNLEKAGMIGQNAARDWFTNPNNGWAPNSPATIERKGSDRPLIDTGEMRKSITYVVREKG